jgi:tetratricopeptide (TPR) repeat protein
LSDSDDRDDARSTEARAIPEGTEIGRYRILDPLGEGGMGVVYRARDLELGRDVALKFLRAAGPGGAKARARLLREAQALARLSHPNVIRVYEVGTHDGDVFVAMERVDGTSVKEWLKTRRGWREIVALYAGAGRGLAAAHAVGLVHRDFKPSNVMVGSDGRARVLDFGLARAAGELPASEETPAPGDPPASDTSRSSSLLSEALTQMGALVGTPQYMAPEQFCTVACDARSDQFSFCVALYEALYGERPFAGRTYEELEENVTSGRIREPPSRAAVPPRLRRVLLRGLSVSPAKRFPSMAALLAELQRDPMALRRRALALAAMVLLLAMGVGGLIAAHRREAVHGCEDGGDKVRRVWNAARKQSLRLAFAATGKTYAADTFVDVERSLDRYASAWVAMHADACAATRGGGRPSEQLLDLRMHCLDERLEELKAQVDVLASADAVVLERASQAAGALGGLERCADAAALTAPVPPPADSATRRKVAALRSPLARAKALEETGKYKEGLEVALAAVTGARSIDYRPVLAEALFVRGQLEEDSGDTQAAAITLRDAVREAEAGRDDELAARSSIKLVQVLGLEARFEEAHDRASQAEAKIERLGRKEVLLSDLLHADSDLYWREGKYADALEVGQRALDLGQRVFGPEHSTVASSLLNLGNVHYLRGSFDQALASYQKALAIWEKSLGPDHPMVAMALDGVAIAEDKQRKFDLARRDFGRALAIRERTFGSDHPRVADSLINLGDEEMEGGSLALAQTYLERALAIRMKTSQPDSTDRGEAHLNLAAVLAARHHPELALPHYQLALEIYEKRLGHDHPDLAEPLRGLGEVYLRQHQPRRAVAPLERALELREAQPTDPMHLAAIRARLAEALWDAGGDRNRARVLANKAMEYYRTVDPRDPERGRVEAWLASR